MTIAPQNPYPEKPDYVYERGMGSERRFQPQVSPYEEGLATDSDIPRNFGRGAYGDTAPFSGNSADTNPEHVFKHADETLRERSHAGSASWIEAQSMLGEFAEGTQQGQTDPHFVLMRNPGVTMRRENAARIDDF